MTQLYFDYQATTPTDKRVIEAMKPFWCEDFANPHAVNHAAGLMAEKAIEKARNYIADLIGARAIEMVFTSGATEANNMALRGIMPHLMAQGKNHIITSNIEHRSILATCEHLEKQGVEVTYLPVDINGIINPAQVADAITDKTALVSIMAVNNEIGTIQPIAEIGKICREHHIHFHVDAAQAIGKIPFNVIESCVDTLSISAHKMYGPKGIGALYIRRSARIQLEPLIYGGTQERGLRAGTLPTPLCIGFGEACRLASQELDKDIEQITGLRDSLLEQLVSALESIHLNGDKQLRIPGNLNISFEGVDAMVLAAAWKDILAVSFGSACSSGRHKISHVLEALNTPHCGSAVRIGLGRFTTQEDVDSAANIIIDTVQRLRHQSIAS